MAAFCNINAASICMHSIVFTKREMEYMHICKLSKIEEEYERVKKLREKSEPSWVLNAGPSDC